jgi:hypothetical protein
MRDSSPRLVRILLNRRLLYISAWCFAVALAVGRIINGHLCFQDRRPLGDPERRLDGNHGHTSIDFGGQWIMGRMLARGFGKELYSRPRQWEVAEQAYPRDCAAPKAKRSDAAQLIQHFMGYDNPRWLWMAGGVSALAGPGDPFGRAAAALRAEPILTKELLDELTHPKRPDGIGGPLYPPIHAFIMLPFALGDYPQDSYFVMQYVQMLLCFVAGLGVSRLSRGRFWWPLASALILVYPGCRGVIDLGQNSALSLALLIWGWAALARGRPTLGGLLWGCLAFKPVWAASFLILLALLRQWRMAGAMALTGAGFILATLSFVGIESWLNWLFIGQEAARIYNLDANWISLSRDVLGIPRRFFIDFDLPRDDRENLMALVLSWMLWAFVFEVTLRVYFLRARRSIPFTGPLPAMLILATWMCTYHFMYYDSLISAFGVCVLIADPRPFFRARALNEERVFEEVFTSLPANKRSLWLVNSFVLTAIALLIFHENVTQPMKFEITGVAYSMTSKRVLEDGTTEMAPRLVVGTSDRYPWDTVIILAIWTWCWITVLAGRWKDDASTNTAQAVEGSADVGGAHQ